MHRTHRLRRRRSRGRPRNKALLVALIGGIVAALGGLGLLGYIVSVAASAPPLGELRARDPGENSSVFSKDGKRLGFIQANELRRRIPGDELPETLKQATVAIEDERFYRHNGVDYEGLVRAAVTNVAAQRTREGGSTLTMQLVRNLYISNEVTYERKIREAKLAEELEAERSKEWILEEYLNTVPYGTYGGQSTIGAEAAARTYFGKPARRLRLHESAMIAGLPQAPTLYSPIRNPDAALSRRNDVLAKMAELGMISEGRARRAMRRELGLDVSRYFQRRIEKYFFDYVKDELLKEYGARTVRRGGLRVHTTIDLDKQRQARAAIAANLGEIGPSSAIVSIDPRNGHIEAMASSADYGDSKFNLAAQGHRQAGSTFKVMTLMTALRLGVDPQRTVYVSRSPTKIDDPQWGEIEVETYGQTSGGAMNLVEATLKSDNSAYIQLALDVGPDEVKKTARMMGIRSELKGYPAESLGGLERGVSPLEMASAYATIASGGVRRRPTAITKVVFPDGRSERPERFKGRSKRVFSEGVASTATRILERNMTSGTGGAAQIGCPAAGKTGTTDNFTDAWFVGYTRRLSTAVWVGYPERQQQMLYENGGGPVNGGSFPARIWGAYMTQAKGSFCGEFPEPSEPFQPQPFEGRYARSGGDLLGDDDDSSEPDTSYVPAVPQAEPGTEEDGDEREDELRDTGSDRDTAADETAAPGDDADADPGQGGGTEFDPLAYDSP